MVPAPKKLAEKRVGTIFDAKWSLDVLLGVGGSAAVYAATHRNGKRAAIKILHPHCAADQSLVARFLREGYLANKIGHPGVVSVLDDNQTEEGSVYLVMELLDGVSLDRHGRGLAAPLEVADVLRVADDLLSILIVAHEKGLVHRDIKPANLFLTTSGELKILDFGIARLMEAAGEGHTQTGMLMGTPAFMPPEQARGRWHDVDARSDVWAVGASMIALMTGRRPRSAETSAEELLAAMTSPLPSLALFVPGAPPALIELVDRAVAFDKDQRWPSAADMQGATREVAKALEESPFRASTTLAIAPQRNALMDATPQPLLPQYGGHSSPLMQYAMGPPGPIDSDLPPSLTTNRSYMRSNAPAATAPPRSTSPAVGAVVGLCLLAGIGSAIAAGVVYMRTHPKDPPQAAMEAPPITPPPVVVPAATTATAITTATAAPPAPNSSGLPTGLAGTAPTATTGATAMTPTATASPTVAAATPPVTPPAGPKPGPRVPRPPKPSAPESTGTDPSKFMDSRF